MAGKSASEAFARGAVEGTCPAGWLPVGAGFKLPPGGGGNLTGFAWRDPGRFQLQVANFNPNGLTFTLFLYCLVKGTGWKTALAHAVLTLAPGAKGTVTRRCPAGYRPIGGYWGLSSPYVAVKRSSRAGRDGWAFRAANLDPENPAKLEGDVLCLKGGKVTYRGSTGRVPGKTGDTPGTGSVKGGKCAKDEVAVAGSGLTKDDWKMEFEWGYAIPELHGGDLPSTWEFRIYNYGDDGEVVGVETVCVNTRDFPVSG